MSTRETLNKLTQQRNERKNHSSKSSSQSHSINQHKHRHKKTKNKQKSSSKSRSKERSRSRQKKQLKRQCQKPKMKPRINGNFLSGLILNQKITNRRLDEEDINKASQKLQKNFNESRRPVTMSQFLSNQTLRMKPKQAEKKLYLCELQRCKKQFESLQQFQKHLQKHKEEL